MMKLSGSRVSRTRKKMAMYTWLQVLHYTCSVLKVISYPYMRCQRTQESSGTDTVVCLFRKSIYLRCKMWVADQMASQNIKKSIFTSIKKVLTSNDINIAGRLRVIKWYVWSTLLFGCDTWTSLKLCRQIWIIRDMTLHMNDNRLERQGHKWRSISQDNHEQIINADYLIGTYS